MLYRYTMSWASSSSDHWIKSTTCDSRSTDNEWIEGLFAVVCVVKKSRRMAKGKVVGRVEKQTLQITFNSLIINSFVKSVWQRHS